MFLTPSEQQLEDEYLTQGYIIRPVADLDALAWMRSQFIRLLADVLEVDADGRPEDILNQIHQKVPVAELNNFRLKIIRGLML